MWGQYLRNYLQQRPPTLARNREGMPGMSNQNTQLTCAGCFGDELMEISSANNQNLPPARQRAVLWTQHPYGSRNDHRNGNTLGPIRVQRRDSRPDFQSLQEDYKKQIEINKTLQNDLRNTNRKLDQATTRAEVLQLKLLEHQQTIESFQNLLAQQTNHSTYEKCIEELNAKISDKDDLIRDVSQRLSETREVLQETCDKLETEKADKEKLEKVVASMESELHNMQMQIQQVPMNNNLERFVEYLQLNVSEQQKVITDLQKKEQKSKDELKKANEEFKAYVAIMDVMKTTALEEALEKQRVTLTHQTANLELERNHLRDMVHKYSAQLEDAAKDKDHYNETLNKSTAQFQDVVKENDHLKKTVADLQQALKKSQLMVENLSQSKAYVSKMDANKATALEEALEKQRVTLTRQTANMEKERNHLRGMVHKYQAQLQDAVKERDRYKETVNKCTTQFQDVVKEKVHLRKTVADQPQVPERSQQMVEDPSQSKGNNRRPPYENESWLPRQHQKMKNNSKWKKHWRRT